MTEWDIVIVPVACIPVWGSTIKSPLMCTVISRYSPCYDRRFFQDQPTNKTLSEQRTVYSYIKCGQIFGSESLEQDATLPACKIDIGKEVTHGGLWLVDQCIKEFITKGQEMGRGDSSVG